MILRYSANGLSARVLHDRSKGSRCTRMTRFSSLERKVACLKHISHAPCQSCFAATISQQRPDREWASHARLILDVATSSQCQHEPSPAGRPSCHPPSGVETTTTLPPLEVPVHTPGKTRRPKVRLLSGTPRPLTSPVGDAASAPNIRPKCSTFWTLFLRPKPHFV